MDVSLSLDLIFLALLFFVINTESSLGKFDNGANELISIIDDIYDCIVYGADE